MCSWLAIWGTTVSGTVILAMEFRHFLCARYNVNPPPLNFKNEMVALSNFLYVTNLAAETEGL